MRNVRSQLAKSLGSQVPVEIMRTNLGKRVDRVDGIVIALGRHWTVIAKLVDYFQDGWEVIRVRDISEIRQPSGEQLAFMNRVLAAKERLTVPPENLSLPSDLHWRDELLHVLSTEELAGVHEERRHADSVRIGLYTGTNRKELGLRQISPAGQWDENETLIKLSQTTRITIGGRYQDALKQYGDPTPPNL